MRRSRQARKHLSSVALTAKPPGPGVRAVLPFAALLLASGATALVFETLWVRQLGRVVGVEVHAVSLALSAFFAGLALGGMAFGRLADRTRQPLKLYAWLEGGVAALGFAATLALSRSAHLFVALQDAVGPLAWLLPAALVGLPAFRMGGTLPALLRGLRPGDDSVPQATGLLYGANTAGAVLGTLATPFLLVPALGITLSALLARLATLWAGKRGGRLLFYEEDAGGTVAVLEQPSRGGAFRRLYIQGVSNSGDTPASLRYMRLQALLPLLIHRGEPRSALVVGFGTGITAGALLAEPGLETRVVVELLPSVVRAGPLFSGLGAASDARLEIRIGDGRQELLRQSQRYDVITFEPPPPSAAGVVNLYSQDFYELVRSRLEPDGLMAQWWPLPAQNDEDSRSLVRSFLDVFPHASAWTTELHEVMLVGSASPIELDGVRIARRFARPGMAGALAEVGIESPEALLATWVTGRAGLERYAGDALPVTDDRPRIEHAAWVRRGEIRRVLPRLLDLASDVPLLPSDPLRAPVQAERQELLGFYRFSLHLMAGERDAAAAALREVLARDPRNRYYLWVAYGQR